MSFVFIKDNFFEKDIFNIILSESQNVPYTPPLNSLQKKSEFVWHRHVLPNKCELQEHVKKLIKKYFFYTVEEMLLSYYVVLDPTNSGFPHVDQKPITHHCLIYLKSQDKINNGTGFYIKKDDKFILDTSVGFKPNRAVFWTSNIYHAPLHIEGDASKRYALANFIGTNKSFQEELKNKKYESV